MDNPDDSRFYERHSLMIMVALLSLILALAVSRLDLMLFAPILAALK